MEILCRSCSAHVAAGDLDLITGLARCRACGDVFRLGRAIESAEPAGERPLAAPPPHITLSESGGARTLHYRWYSTYTAMLVVSSVVLAGFIALTLILASGPIGTAARAMELAFIAADAALAYQAVAELLNTTTFTVERSWLRVRHGPVPWRGSVDLPARAVRQLYCDLFEWHNENGGTQRYYTVMALLRDGTRTRVSSRQRSREAAVYIERCLETWLGLADEPVGGEMEPSAEEKLAAGT
jgi:hypothetical protein